MVYENPPNIDQIDAAFGIRGQRVLFAYGDRIYNPTRFAVPPQLIAHEMVHGRRQGLRASDIERWWERYIADAGFRLEEELPAHIAEFEKACEVEAPRWHSQRNMRRMMAAVTARRLAAPLYGNLISIDDAKKAILEGGR